MKKSTFPIKDGHYEIKVSAENCYANDVTLPWDFNPHNTHLFLIHEAGFHSALVWAGNLQDALDELADNGFLDRYLVEEKDLKDYVASLDDDDGNAVYEGITHLGNASEPFDIELLTCVEIKDVSTLDTELLCRFAEARGAGESTLEG